MVLPTIPLAREELGCLDVLPQCGFSRLEWRLFRARITGWLRFNRIRRLFQFATFSFLNEVSWSMRCNLRCLKIFRFRILDSLGWLVVSLVFGNYSSVGAAEPKVGEVASADGIPVRYETRGEGGPTLVFIHGWCCNRSFWEPQIRFFSEHQQVVAIDLAGHGESGGDRKDSTMAAFGQDVAAVVRHLKLPRVILIGHSMGGPVMLEAGALLKEELAGLIAVDAFTDPDEAYTYQQMTDYLRPFQDDFPKAMRAALLHEEDFFRKGTDQKLIDRILPVMTSAPAEMGQSAFLGMLDFANTRQRPLMAKVKAPFLCINAKRDEAKVADGKKHAPQFEVIALPESGHFLMMEHPDEFNALLRTELGKMRAGK